MKYNLPDLYLKSRTGQLTQDEVYWTEQQARHQPYFQLLQLVLAQQEKIQPVGNTYVEKGWVYAPRRKNLVAQWNQPEVQLFSPSSENHLEPEIIGSPELLLELPEVSLPENTAPTIEESIIINTPEADVISPIITISSPTLTHNTEEEISTFIPEPLAEPVKSNPDPAVPAPSGINSKLDYKIKFRVQMYGWKPIAIQQQLAEYRKNNPSTIEEKPGQYQNEKIADIGKLSRVTEIPDLLEGSFELDLSETTIETFHTSESISSPYLSESLSITEAVEIPVTPFNTEEEEETSTYDPSKVSVEIVFSEAWKKKLKNKSIYSENAVSKIPDPSVVSIPTPHPNIATEKLRTKKISKEKMGAIIDRFIENEPDISFRPKPSDHKVEEVVKKSTADSFEIVSETLAGIYLKQGNKIKAIRMYEKLMLLYPEKCSYFESLLKKIS